MRTWDPRYGTNIEFHNRGYPAKRALPTMLTHDRYGPFGRISSQCGWIFDIHSHSRKCIRLWCFQKFPNPIFPLGAFYKYTCVIVLTQLQQKCFRYGHVAWQHQVSSVTIVGLPQINSLAPGKFEWNFRYVIFKQIFVIDGWLKDLSWNCPNMNVTRLQWWSVNIGSGNGLVPSGNKPLHEPMLTEISVIIWCH